jgi:hypothetical protein
MPTWNGIEFGSIVTSTFSEYWTAQLAASGGSYTPAVTGLFGGASEIVPTIYDVQIWVYGNTWGAVGYQAIVPTWSPGSYLRIYNNDPSNAYYAVLFRAQVESSEPTYERYSSGTASDGAWYTPAASGVYRICLFKSSSYVGTSLNASYLRVQLYDSINSAWRIQGNDMNYWAVGVADKMRFGHNYGSSHYYLTMRWS